MSFAWFGANLRRAVILAPLGAVLLATAAQANSTFPPRKPGFWQTTMVMKMVINGQVMGDGTPIITAMCSNAQTDAIEDKDMDGDNGNCLHFSVSGENGVYTMNGSCPDPMGGGGNITTHGTVIMTGDTAAHVESTTVSAHMSGHMVGDSKWVGACPAGAAPGDVGHMVNGQFVKISNILTQ